MTNWVRLRILGQGSFGIVFLAKPVTGIPYYVAVKLTPLRNYSSLLKEKHVLSHFIGCPEIVQYIGSEITMETDSPHSICYSLILEYAAGGTLADLINQQKKLSENEVKEYLRMILRGLSCIHGKGFVHADLKPANILAFLQNDGKMKLKIADFGLSKSCDEVEEHCNFKPRFRGTPKYMSPESVFGAIDTALDIWSVGCILVKMVSGRSVWDDCTDQVELMIKLVYEMKVPKIPEELSREGKDFLKKCFDQNPKRRWTADMLLQHSYLREEKKGDKITRVPKELCFPHLLCKLRKSTIQPCRSS